MTTETRKPIFYSFANEIDNIRNEEFKSLVICAYEHADQSFQEAYGLHDEIKRMYVLTEQFVDSQRLTGSLKDLVLTSVLLCDITLSSLPVDLEYLHPVTVRPFLKTLDVEINKQMLEALLNLIESHEGSESPSNMLEPKPGTPAHVLALLQVVKRLPCVSICPSC